MNFFLKASTLLFVVVSMAQAKVTLNTASFQEQTKVTVTGEKVKEWVKASKVIPGTVVRYVNTLENQGDDVATKLVIKNPIPKNMEYVANSASCASECTLSYSVDGGKSYKQPSELYVGEGEKRHLAKASDYTDIKWVVSSLSATAQSSVEYQARLK